MSEKWLEEQKNDQMRKESGILPAVHSIIEYYPDAACFFDPHGNLKTYNNKFFEVLDGHNADLNSSIKQIVQHIDYEKGMNERSKWKKDILLRKNEESSDVNLLFIPIMVAGNLEGSLCLMHSERHSEDDLSGEPFLSLSNWDEVNQINVAVWSYDLTLKKVVLISEAIQEIFEIPKEEVDTETWKGLVHPEDIDEFKQIRETLLERDKIIHTYRIITPNQNLKWLKEHIVVVRDANGDQERLMGSIEDITATRQLQQKLEDHYYIDELTQLPNRNYAIKVWGNWCQEHLENGKSFAVIRFNLERINQVYDVFGHQLGDEVFKKLGQRVKELVDSEGMVFRYDGDHFLIYAKHQNEMQGYIDLVENIQENLKIPVSVNHYDFHFSASFGISLFPNDGKEYSDLMKNTREALRKAKQLGKNSYQIFSEAMDIESYKMFHLENDLRTALQKKELYFDFQPKVDAGTQKAVGAEALIRWNHPTWGIVSPAEFICLAEEGEMIHQIADFVMEEVCRQVREWENQKVPFKFVSLNLSPKNFLKRDLVDRLKRYMEHYDVDPTKLDIEVTEGLLLHNTDIVNEQLMAIRRLGVKISLDDFGVGYTSINYLKQFPFQKIKIDRSFIRKITENQTDATIVQSIIGLSHGLNKNVVAEGVEEIDQYNELKEMGCDFIQGYLFSRPISPQQMKEAFLMEKLKPDRKKDFKVERRTFFRVGLPLPLSTRMAILSLNNEKVSLGSSKVLVENISPVGLRFLSHLRLTSRADIVFSFETELMGTQLRYKGKIVWGEEKEKENDIFRYGVEFLSTQQEKEQLSALLKQIRSNMNHPALYEKSSFVSESPTDFILKKC